MPHYKAPDSKLHWLDSNTHEYILPPGAVEITEEEADEIANSQAIQPSKEERITALQAAYDSDLDKLNKAWLAALIADGAGEAARQAALKAQMEELVIQLDTDIFNIIMEE